MRKQHTILLIILITMAYGIINAQDKDGIYIIIKAQKINKLEERTESVIRYGYHSSSGKYRDDIQVFRLYHSDNDSQDWSLRHFYLIQPKNGDTTIKTEDQHKTFFKDSLYLKDVECLYWDDVKDLSYSEIKGYIGPLLFRKMPDGRLERRTIYVVDLAEKHPDEKIKLYQVEDGRKEWFNTFFLDENEKRLWEREVKNARGKVDQRREQRKEKSFKK